jgi:hypothetical protein
MAVCEPQLATSWLIVLRRNPFRPFLADFIETRRAPQLRLNCRHSGAMPTGPASGRPDDRLRIEPGIQGFPDVQLHI